MTWLSASLSSDVLTYDLNQFSENCILSLKKGILRKVRFHYQPKTFQNYLIFPLENESESKTQSPARARSGSGAPPDFI